jgi:hypothetical protein
LEMPGLLCHICSSRPCSSYLRRNYKPIRTSLLQYLHLLSSQSDKNVNLHISKQTTCSK